MAGFTVTEWIDATPADVFHFSLNPENASKILPTVQKMEQVTPGNVAVGAILRETRLVKGDEHTTDIKIIAYEPPHRYSAEVETNGITVTYHYTFTPQDGGTQARLECDVAAGGVKKLMVPAVVAVMKKEDGDHLERLKQALGAELQPG